MKKFLVSLMGRNFSFRGIATVAVINLIGVGLMLFSIQQLCEAYILDDRGVIVQAHVSNWRVTTHSRRGRTWTTYGADCVFNANGRTYQVDDWFGFELSQSAWDETRRTGQIAVIYAPDFPDFSRVSTGDPCVPRAWSGFAWGTLVGAMFLAFTPLCFAFDLLRRALVRAALKRESD